MPELKISEKLSLALSECEIEITSKNMFIEPPNKQIAALLCESAKTISKAAKVSLGVDVSLNWDNVLKGMGVFEFPIS